MEIVSYILSSGTVVHWVYPEGEQRDETQEQSGAPMIDYEVPDKVKDYDFNYEFVPEGE